MCVCMKSDNMESPLLSQRSNSSRDILNEQQQCEANYNGQQRDLLPRSLLSALREHQRARLRSRDACLHTHLPLLRGDISRKVSGHARQPKVILLGDEVLSNLASELERPPLPQRPSAEAQNEPCSYQPIAKPEYIDLRVPGDRICNILYRFDVGLFDALVAALEHAGPAIYDVIVLNVGTHDLMKTTEQKAASQMLDGSALTAFNTLLDLILHINSTLQILVVGILPRKDVPETHLQRATRELFASTLPRKQAGEARIHLLESPIALRKAHLQNRVMLSLDGCEVLAASLRPIVDRLIASSLSAEATPSKEDVPETTALKSPHGLLRPAQDVLSRILHDADHFDPNQIIVGYVDRHDGMQELRASAWEKESTHEEFIPLHRIRYFRRAGRPGQVLWDREKRIDEIFGTRMQ